MTSVFLGEGLKSELRAQVDERVRPLFLEATERLLREVPQAKLDGWYLCDFLQVLLDEGLVPVSHVDIQRQWVEIDTPQDLERASATVQYLDNPASAVNRVVQFGQLLRSEANDLKRPLPLLTQEAGLEEGSVPRKNLRILGYSGVELESFV